MKVNFRLGVIFKLIFLLIFNHLVVAQDSTLVPDSTAVLPDGVGEIKLTTTVDVQEVPKNRLVTFSVRLEWYGNLAAYKILEVKDPAVENFTIVNNAATHRTEVKDGVSMAIKILEFVLEPQSLGMAYVGDVLVRYQNVLNGEENQLFTNRLGVKVIDPVPEPGSHFLFVPKKWLLPLIICLLILVVVWLSFSWWRKRRERIRQEQAALSEKLTLEQDYLEQLKQKIDLNSSDLISQFAEISRIFRKYLTEKFQIEALGGTTSYILNELPNHSDNTKFLETSAEILKTCDLAKFSGGGLDNAELSRVYTQTELILEQAMTSTEKEANNDKN